MAVTGTQVSDRINAFFNDTTNTKWSAGQKLEAVNAAIDAAWPDIKAVSQDTSIALVSGTDTYTPTATPEVEWGFSQCYVSNGNFAPVLLRGVRQRQSGTTYSILVPDRINMPYAGETLRLLYNSRLARLTVIGGSVELPLDYLWKQATYFLLHMTDITAANFDVKQYQDMTVLYEKEARESLWRNKRGNLDHMIPMVADFGVGQAYDPNQGHFNV